MVDHQPRNGYQQRAVIAAVVLDHYRLPIHVGAVDVGLEPPGAVPEQNRSDGVQAGHIQRLVMHGSSPDRGGAEMSRGAQVHDDRGDRSGQI
ncbi:hypothetical protein IXO390_18540 [Xanthomonas oryzae pv. oryzae]|nr:hypothetical protein IXO141_09560 [Xanthomonas oryzae pv. oryzae]OLI90623.1 hypothetical protein IXO390_18540 [Xanthomonas oryzae pv. oryzae]